MTNLKLFKTGSIAFILLGILHLLAQAFGKPDDPIADKLMLDMANFKIYLIGEHSLLKFHQGFSIMMGFLLSVFGIQNFLLAREILINKKAFVSIIVISAIAFLIAFMFFHMLAFGFIFISLVCFTIAFIKSKSKEQRTANNV
jgi:hypothetical protein